MQSCKSEIPGEPSTLTAAEVAGLLRLKVATFLRKRAILVAGGFPRPLPLGSGSPVWSRRLVDLWIATNGAALPVDAEAPLDPIAAAREALEARIGERAA